MAGQDLTTRLSNCTGTSCTPTDDDDKEVPIEAVAFLGAVAAFVCLLIVFFLYLNKSLCFKECGGFPCIDKIPPRDNTLESEDDDGARSADALESGDESHRRRSYASVEKSGTDNKSFSNTEASSLQNRLSSGESDFPLRDGSEPVVMVMDDGPDSGKERTTNYLVTTQV